MASYGSSPYVRIVRNDFPALLRVTPQRAGSALSALAQEGENYAKLLINNSPASGRTYRRGSVTHRASAPGEPPASDTGTLINSIRWENIGPMRRRIVAATLYAIYLEFGNTRGMAPRPFFTPTAKHLETVAAEVFDHFLTK